MLVRVAMVANTTVPNIAKLCRSRYFYLPRKNFSTCLKLNSIFIENDHSKILFTKLSQKNNYKYLDPDIYNCPDAGVEKSTPLPLNLLQALKSREDGSHFEDHNLENLEKELQTFKEWARTAQLRVGFLLHVVNEKIKSKEYLTKVIKVLTTDFESIKSHELIAILLLIYFRRDMTVDELSELLDIDELQHRFGNFLLGNQLSQEEIIAGCLGIKKIEGITVNSKLMRDGLYRSLSKSVVMDNQLKDFYFMTVMTTLSRGNKIYHDNDSQILQALEVFKNEINHVAPMTAIKMMSFGISKGLENSELSESVVKGLSNKLDTLNVNDILSLAMFYSLSENYDELMVTLLKGEVSRVFQEVSTVAEIVNILKTLSYLAVNQIYRLETSKPFLDAFVDILPSEVSQNNLSTIARTVVTRAIEGHQNREAILADLSSLDTNSSYANIICQISGQLCFNMRLDEVEVDHMMSMDTAAAILSLFYKKIPLQIYSPQMSLKGLENRSKHLVICYRQLVSYIGGEKYCSVARILPQFPDPVIVFGTLAGTPMKPPEYFSDPNILRPKRAPIGDWYALVMANKKNLGSDNKIVGIDEIKVRQLKWLGFHPIVVPYSIFLKGDKKISSILRFERVDFPNLDDGYIDSKFTT